MKKGLLVLLIVIIILSAVCLIVDKVIRSSTTPEPTFTPSMPPEFLTPSITEIIFLTETFTSTPTGPPWFAKLKQDDACIGGPGEDYAVVAIMSTGVQVEVTGINSEGKDLLQISYPTSIGNCWIEITSLDFAFDLSVLQRIPTTLIQENSRCRFGPDEIFNVATYLSKDMEVLIGGVSVDAAWILVRNPPGYLRDCWVAKRLTTYNSSSPYVGIATSPPIPTIPIPPTRRPDGGEPPLPAPSPTPQMPSNPPRCNDGRDNDHDGLTDYPDDPDCSSPDDDTERPH